MGDRWETDPVTGEAVHYIDGVEVARVPWDALLGSGTPTPAGGNTSVAADGTIVQPSVTPRDPLQAAPAEQATSTSAPAQESADWYSEGGYARGTARGGGSGWASGYDSGGVGTDGNDPFSGIPPYQSGQLHPAAGGAPLVPGGIFAQESAETGDFDDRRQMTSDSGATAGPFGTRAAPAPAQPSYGGNGVQSEAQREGGGSGGGGSPLYDQLRAKAQAMASKLRGAGGGEPASSSTTTSSQDYARQGRRMDRASDRYNEALYNPEPLPVHGWAKRQGFKPGTIEAALGDPTLLLPSAVPGYESNDSPFSEALERQPMTDLALIMEGTQNKRGLTTRTPVVKPPRILRQQGVKPVKPEFKRTLDPSEVANTVASMWKELSGGGSYQDVGFLDRDTLLGNLATAKRGSAVRQGLRQQFETDPNAALESTRSYLQAALTAGPDNPVTRTLARRGDQRVTQMGSQLLRMKPKKASRYVTQLAGSFL